MSKGSIDREIEKIYDRIAELECRSKLWYMGAETPIDDAIRLILDYLELDLQGPSLKKREDWRPAVCSKKKGKK